jgi:hypothetical protein
MALVLTVESGVGRSTAGRSRTALTAGPVLDGLGATAGRSSTMLTTPRPQRARSADRAAPQREWRLALAHCSKLEQFVSATLVQKNRCATRIAQARVGQRGRLPGRIGDAVAEHLPAATQPAGTMTAR